MVNFSIDQIRELMDLQYNIRNISVIAHVDHGKSTLTDSLICKAGIISKASAGEARYTDSRPDEQERGITIKSTSVSLYYNMGDAEVPALSVEEANRLKAASESHAAAAAAASAAADAAADADAAPAADAAAKPSNADEWLAAKIQQNEKNFLINLIDSPGHVDFSSEVTAALRVTDGALVVVDCVEGVAVQTETVLRQAIGERIRPILFVNKMDRCLLELQTEAEEAYHFFNRAIESANVVIETCKDPVLGDVPLEPGLGNVGFGSGLQGWGFTLGTFANMYAKKFGMAKDKMMAKFWGDNYISPDGKKWSTAPVNDGKAYNRGFSQFIYKPIQMLFKNIMDDKKDETEKLLTRLELKVPVDAKDLTGKALAKRMMQIWLPLADTLLQMIIMHLPSPYKAQKYRADLLYSGPMDDPCAMAIKKCDPNGPLMLFISKMVPTSDKGRFYAFGRVFAGTVRTNQSVRIFGPDYHHGSNVDLFENKKVQRTVLMMGRTVEQIESCPCGNVVGLVGIDTYLLKAGTLTTHDEAHPFHCMKFSVSPVVRVAVNVKNSADLAKLAEGLKRLQKSDPLVMVFTSKTGEQIIAGAGELHLEICLKDLQEDFMKGAPLTISDPVVPFCETITETSSQQCVSKSPNKHNRLYCTAEPLGEDFCKAVEKGFIDIECKGTENKKRAKILNEDWGWDKNDALRIWTFGAPPDSKANVLIDQTKAVSYLNEVKEHVVNGFGNFSAAGVYIDEPCRGVRVNLQDIVLHADSIHRGAGQITPTAERCFKALQIVSGPKLLEPLYLADIVAPREVLSGIYQTLQARRGRQVYDGNEDSGNAGLAKVRAHLPVLESFGFTQLLRQNTGGKAFPQMIFDKWEVMRGDMIDPASDNNKVVTDVRKRKGMKAGMPDFNDYYDKI